MIFPILVQSFVDAGIAQRIVGGPTLFDAVFTDRTMYNYRDVFAADATQSATFNKPLRKYGLLKFSGKCYPSLAIGPDDLV